MPRYEKLSINMISVDIKRLLKANDIEFRGNTKSNTFEVLKGELDISGYEILNRPKKRRTKKNGSV